MNKRFLTLAIVGSLIVLGGIYLAYQGIQNSTKEVINSSAEKFPPLGSSVSDNKINGKEKLTGDFLSLLELNQVYECSFESKKASNSYSGNVFVGDDGKKILIETSMNEASGEVVVSNVLMDGSYVYIWIANAESGIKTPITESDYNFLPDTNMQLPEVFSVDQLEFDCTSWVLDESKFMIPQGVEFIDFGEQIQTSTDYVQDL